MFLWEVFPWDFCPIISGAFVRSGTDVGQEGLAPNPHSRPNDPMVFYQVEVRALLGPVKFFHTKLIQPCLYGIQNGLSQTVPTTLLAWHW